MYRLQDTEITASEYVTLFFIKGGNFIRCVLVKITKASNRSSFEKQVTLHELKLSKIIKAAGGFKNNL